MTPDEFLDILSGLTAHQIVEHIRRGTVTLEFLEAEGSEDFPYTKRTEVRTLLANTSEETDWAGALQSNTAESYNAYLQKYPNGKYSQMAINAINRLRTAAPGPANPGFPPPPPSQPEVAPEEQAWAMVSKTNRRQLTEFIATYPSSGHVREAQYYLSILPSDLDILKQQMANQAGAAGRVTVIQQAIANPDSEITADLIYDEINRDKSWLSEYEIKSLIAAGTLDYYNLMSKSGIDSDFIRYISQNHSDMHLPMDYIPITDIPGNATEIYFWGIPSSGKTCTIGAVLSSLKNGDVVDYTDFDSNSQGYGYMNQLSMLFSNTSGQTVFQLPKGNPITGMFAMRCDVVKDQKLYPLTFVDVAGEMLISMYIKMTGMQLDGERQFMLDRLTDILTDNDKKLTKRKIHFFVIEYNGHNRTIPLPNGTSVDQVTLLEGVKNYINQYNEIFAKATDAIYVLMTKSDLAGQGNIGPQLKEYMAKHYRGFYKSLVGVAQNKKYEIDKGKVTVMPFTLGQVCFQSLCKFNPATANNVINTILSRVWFEKTDKASRFINAMKK